MKHPLNNKKIFSFSIIFLIFLSIGVYFVKNDKLSRKNSVRFVKIENKDKNFTILELPKEEQKIVSKFKEDLSKCITSDQDREIATKLKEMLNAKLDSVDSKKKKQKKKEIYIKFCDIEKLTNKKNVRKFIYSFRKCKNENLKKYEPAKKKELKSIIGKLSLKEIIEIYNGVN